MENPLSAQYLLFRQIKDSMPVHQSLVDEVADLLHISMDSAYRRIRGEKAISFEELSILCRRFKISLDQFLHLQSDSIIFSGLSPSNSEDFFLHYLTNLLHHISYLLSYKKKHLYFILKDLPWISYFQVPELASFKFFLWMKSVLSHPKLREKQFSLKANNDQYLDLGLKIIRAYCQIPGTEIWNLEGLNTTLQQIDFYKESNLFESAEDYTVILNKLESLINHTERQAELEVKFLMGDKPSTTSAAFNMYHNDLALGDNTVLAEIDDNKITFLNHNVIHFISTRDKPFNEYTFNCVVNLLHKSTRISGVGEKARVKFFHGMRSKIASRKSYQHDEWEVD
jgi:hypothetical protein